VCHAICTQVNQGDPGLLVIGNQIGNLTFNPSFDHNLCFKYPNGSCKPILDIYILRSFQWYKELFNIMSFDPYNCPLKTWESIGTPTPKVGTHLGVWGFIPSHSPTFLGGWSVTPKLHSWPTPLQALALVASPKLRLWQLGSFLDPSPSSSFCNHHQTILDSKSSLMRSLRKGKKKTPKLWLELLQALSNYFWCQE
jgi:hypothetical protein